MSPKVGDEYREQKRREILEAAAAVFARKGYEKTTMKDVVEESGLSRGGVYLYFSSTEEMMLALQMSLDRENEDQLEEALALGEGSVWKAFTVLIRQSARDMAAMAGGLAPAIYEFYLSGYREGKHMDLLMSRYRRGIGLYEQMIARGVEQGEFQPLLPAGTIASVMISLMDGIIFDCCMMGPEPIQLENQLEAALLSLHHLLGVKPE